MRIGDLPEYGQTFLFADLAGYSALTEAHGDEHAADVAAEFVRSVRALLDQHGAEHVKAIGEPCSSASPTRGPGSSWRDGDWFGSAVSVAARVAALAEPGEIPLTAAGADTPAGARRTQQLKIIPGPVENFVLELDEHLTEQPLVFDPVCRMAVDPRPRP